MLIEIKEFQQDILSKYNTTLLTFALTDMFYISVMFLVHVMPVSMTIGLSVAAGTIISGVITNKITSAKGKDSNEAIAEKLSYFPVTKKVLRKAQYSMLVKITLIQLAIVCVPILVTCFQFDLQKTCAALFATAFSMLGFGVFLIEMNLPAFRRK